MPTKTLKPFQILVNGKYGAPMGRQEDEIADLAGLIYLQKVPMIDGDYDEGGAYWGGGSPLYCAWDDEGHAIYIRAKDSSAAKKKLPAHWKYASKTPKAKNSIYVEEMLQQYMETALWASSDMDAEEGNDTPLNTNYSVDDIAKKAQKGMLDDCQKFYDKNQELLEDPEFGWPADQAGHEFFLDRNGTGSGFYDSKYGTDESREALSKACKSFGEVRLYVQSGKIYSE
jgi:hypothetical protein